MDHSIIFILVFVWSTSDLQSERRYGPSIRGFWSGPCECGPTTTHESFSAGCFPGRGKMTSPWWVPLPLALAVRQSFSSRAPRVPLIPPAGGAHALRNTLSDWNDVVSRHAVGKIPVRLIILQNHGASDSTSAKISLRPPTIFGWPFKLVK